MISDVTIVFVCLVMSDSSVTPWTAAHQAPLFMEFSRQEYWSRLPFLPPGIFLTQGSNLHLFASPALAGRFFTTASPRKPHLNALFKLYNNYKRSFDHQFIPFSDSGMVCNLLAQEDIAITCPKSEF